DIDEEMEIAKDVSPQQHVDRHADELTQAFRRCPGKARDYEVGVTKERPLTPLGDASGRARVKKHFTPLNLEKQASKDWLERKAIPHPAPPSSRAESEQSRGEPPASTGRPCSVRSSSSMLLPSSGSILRWCFFDSVHPHHPLGKGCERCLLTPDANAWLLFGVGGRGSTVLTPGLVSVRAPEGTQQSPGPA